MQPTIGPLGRPIQKVEQGKAHCSCRHLFMLTSPPSTHQQSWNYKEAYVKVVTKLQRMTFKGTRRSYFIFHPMMMMVKSFPSKLGEVYLLLKNTNL